MSQDIAMLYAGSPLLTSHHEREVMQENRMAEARNWREDVQSHSATVLIGINAAGGSGVRSDYHDELILVGMQSRRHSEQITEERHYLINGCRQQLGSTC